MFSHKVTHVSELMVEPKSVWLRRKFELCCWASSLPVASRQPWGGWRPGVQTASRPPTSSSWSNRGWSTPSCCAPTWRRASCDAHVRALAPRFSGVTLKRWILSFPNEELILLWTSLQPSAPDLLLQANRSCLLLGRKRKSCNSWYLWLNYYAWNHDGDLSVFLIAAPQSGAVLFKTLCLSLNTHIFIYEENYCMVEGIQGNPNMCVCFLYFCLLTSEVLHFSMSSRVIKILFCADDVMWISNYCFKYINRPEDGDEYLDIWVSHYC